ncbi:MAG: hypothetical protein ACKOOL_12670 [Novosphingobium sp.]
MDFFKALIPGTILTFVVCMIMGAGHSTGGFLNIRHYFILDHGFYWSWILFTASTGLSWVLMIITPK